MERAEDDWGTWGTLYEGESRYQYDDVRAFPEWTGYVHADSVLDGLIADGKAVPMIVVMPNGRALPDDRPPPPDKIYTPENAAGFAYHFAQRLFR